MTRTNRRSHALTVQMVIGMLLVPVILACGGSDSSSNGDAVYAPVHSFNDGGSQGSAAPVEPAAAPAPAAPSEPTEVAAPSLPTEPTAPTEVEPPAAPVEPAPVEPAGPTLSVAFASTLPEGEFSPLEVALLDSTPSVYVVADWTGVADDQIERLTLTDPDGAVYHARNIALNAATTSLVRAWTLPDGTRRVTFKLLIRGTTIETYGQVGTWTAKVALVGGSLSGTAALELQ